MLREVPEELSPAAAPPGVRRSSDIRILGSLDVVQPARLAGWALDRAAPDTPAEVDLLLDNTVIATVIADRPRKDLEKAGIGTGRHGFEAVLTEPLAAEALVRLIVRVRGADDAQGHIVNRAALSAKPSAETAMIAVDLRELRDAVRAVRELVQPLGEGLAERSDAIDIAQARLEAVTTRMEGLVERRLESGGRSRGLPAVVTILTGVALISLGLGIFNLAMH